MSAKQALVKMWGHASFATLCKMCASFIQKKSKFSSRIKATGTKTLFNALRHGIMKLAVESSWPQTSEKYVTAEHCVILKTFREP